MLASPLHNLYLYYQEDQWKTGPPCFIVNIFTANAWNFVLLYYHEGSHLSLPFEFQSVIGLESRNCSSKMAAVTLHAYFVFCRACSSPDGLACKSYTKRFALKRSLKFTATFEVHRRPEETDARSYWGRRWRLGAAFIPPGNRRHWRRRRESLSIGDIINIQSVVLR